MSDAFFDTDLLIRYVTGDDPAKRASVRNLLRQAAQGAIRLRAPDTVIADAVYVLSSPRLYRIPRQQIRNWLSILIRWPGLEVDNRVALLKALAMYANSSLDFGDLMIVAAMDEASVPTLYSYDHDFNRFSQVRRKEPS